MQQRNWNSLKGMLGLMSLTLAASFAQADPLSGILETKGAYSALFSLSEESGDLVGNVFQNDTPAGRRILATCLAGMPCALDGARLREPVAIQTERLGFEDQPSGWQEIIAVKTVQLESAIGAVEQKVRTRHGVLEVDAPGMRFLWRGKPLLDADLPAEEYRIVRHYEWGPWDVLLVQSTRGKSCPAMFRFLTISPQGIRTTSAFGTCSDLVYPFMNTDGQVTPYAIVRMVDFQGAGSSETMQNQAGRTRAEYIFRAGQLTRNGRPVLARNTRK